MTNKEFSQSAEFVQICKEASITPTKRQASKYRNKIRKWKFLRIKSKAA